MQRTANPALNEKVFTGTSAIASGQAMTLEGSVNKTIWAIAITTIAACFTYMNPQLASLTPAFIIVGLIMAIVLMFKPALSPMLVPAYAAVEGCALGSISLAFESRFPGIVFQAVSLTFGTLFCLLIAYKSKWISPTENFKLGVVAATGSIFFVYLISMISGLFGYPLSFLHDSSPLSIGISVVVVIVAALNLVLDFDFIENGAASGRMPKYMEWYAAFGLLVTLIWLYLEMLRLLAKVNSRD